MTSGRWLVAAIAVAGTLAGWVALAERAPVVTRAPVEEPVTIGWPEAEPAPAVDVAPDVTSAATRRGRR
ncbi:MAG TPA: hypothetical protein VF334_10915 [Polyangia bacterium]